MIIASNFIPMFIQQYPHVRWLNHAKPCSTVPMDPVVPSERKWDWGIIYYNLEGFLYLLTQWPWIHKACEPPHWIPMNSRMNRPFQPWHVKLCARRYLVASDICVELTLAPPIAPGRRHGTNFLGHRFGRAVQIKARVIAVITGYNWL